LTSDVTRLYAGRSLVQRSYVMHIQIMSFCVDSPYVLRKVCVRAFTALYTTATVYCRPRITPGLQ